MPAGLDALAAGAADVLGAMGESFVLYTSPVAKTFTAIRRSGIGEIPEGGVITRLVLDAPRSAFASIPVSGLDVGQGTTRWRLAEARISSRYPSYIELVLDSETK